MAWVSHSLALSAMMRMEQWDNKDEVMADNEVGEKEGEEVSFFFVIGF